MICLGDYVGYGADPEWTIETVMGLVDGGAMAVRGNHDNAVGSAAESMNAQAQAAIEWTRGRLSAPQRGFLAELPLILHEEDRSTFIPKPATLRNGAMSRIARMRRAASWRHPRTSRSAAISTNRRSIQCLQPRR